MPNLPDRIWRKQRRVAEARSMDGATARTVGGAREGHGLSRRVRAGIVCTVATLVFLAVAVISSAAEGRALDLLVLERLRGSARPWLTYLMLAVSFFGDWRVVAVLALCYLWRARPPAAEARLLAAACLGAGLLSLCLKTAIQRPRPDVLLRLAAVGGWSLPSGHALLSLAFFGMVALLAARRAATPWRARALWMAAATVVVLVGVSRLYLGVHYLTDVLAGYAVAVAWVSLVLVCHGDAGRP